MTFREDWYADGYLLTEGNVRDWSDRSGTGKTGGMVGTNTTMPYRRGETWTRKNIGPGDFIFNMWIYAADAEAARDQYDTILRQTIRPERLVEWKRVPNDGSEYRSCMGEVVSAVEPTFVGQRTYRIGLEVRVPAGKWQGSTVHTLSTAAGAGFPKQIDFTGPLGQSTAPLDDLTYQIIGPIASGWVLSDTNGPDSLTGNEQILAGQSLTINADTWAITGSGFTPNLAAYAIKGPRLMTVATGNASTTPGVKLTGTSGASGTQLVVSGKTGWLV